MDCAARAVRGVGRKARSLRKDAAAGSNATIARWQADLLLNATASPERHNLVASRDPAEEAAREGVQSTASAMSGRAVERGLAVPPTIRIGAGGRVTPRCGALTRNSYT